MPGLPSCRKGKRRDLGRPHHKEHVGDEGTGHKHQQQPQDYFIVGKTVHEQQHDEEAGKPDFQDSQAKQSPGPPSEPCTDAGPKSDDGQGPKEHAENTVHAYLPIKR